MNCSGSRVSLLRLAALGFAGALVVAGCGGSGDVVKKDGGLDGPGGGLDGPGVAALKITPTSQDFGSIAVGSMSATPVMFNVTNSGGITGTPAVTVSNGDFVATGCAAAIPANGSCMVSVSFKPGSVGA